MLKRAVAALALSLPALVQAAPMYDFASFAAPGASNDLFLQSVSLGGVTASAWVTNDTNYTLNYGGSDLWARNQGGDHGLGVCSEGHATCVNGEGNINEVSNEQRTEGILVARDNTVGNWSDIWLSSLDSNGGTGAENMFIWYSNTLGFSNRVALSFGAFPGGAVEGSVWGLLSASQQSAIASSKYLFFSAPAIEEGLGRDNDFLVWGVSAIPEPESYAMLIAGLGLMGFVARRRQRKLAA